MTIIQPISDQRKRRLDGRVLDDGEAISFNIALVRDAACNPASTSYFTHIARNAERSRALATARYDDSAKLVDMPEGSNRSIGSTASAPLRYTMRPPSGGPL